MSSLQKCKSAKLRVSAFFLKNNCCFLAYIMKISYLCIIDAKRTKASENCGITMEQKFLSARESVITMKQNFLSARESVA